MEIKVTDTLPSPLEFQRRVMTGAATGAIEAAKDVKDKALPVTPMDTGDLRESVKMETYGNINTFTAKVSFGGSKAPYAANVHAGKADNGAPIENWTTPGTGKEYLSKTLQSSLIPIFTLIVNNIKRNLF